MSRGIYGRERIPFQPDTDTPQTQCPKCGHWVDDHDGFGVLAHGTCGFCSHPSTLDGICGICGECHERDKLTAVVRKGDIVKFNGGLYPVVDISLHNQFVKIDLAGKQVWQARMALDFHKRPEVYEAFRKCR